MTAPVLEFFFDLMSPYAYLASTQLEGLSQRTGARVWWRPAFLPGLLKATGNLGPTQVPAKAAHLWVDLSRWTQAYGLPALRVPVAQPSVAAQANRLVLVCEGQGAAEAFARRLFHRIWALGEDGNAPEVLEAALREVDVEPSAALALAGTEALKERLRANTAEAVARGAYGVPTFFVGPAMFVGNDRLRFVEQALASAAPPPAEAGRTP